MSKMHFSGNIFSIGACKKLFDFRFILNFKMSFRVLEIKKTCLVVKVFYYTFGIRFEPKTLIFSYIIFRQVKRFTLYQRLHNIIIIK